MWILEEIVSLLGSYSVEDLLPTAKCVAPTLFCGPCTDTKINIDQRTCSNIYEQSGNSCLHWLGELSIILNDLRKMGGPGPGDKKIQKLGPIRTEQFLGQAARRSLDLTWQFRLD